MRGLLLRRQFSVCLQLRPRSLDSLRLPFRALRGIHFAPSNNLPLGFMQKSEYGGQRAGAYVERFRGVAEHGPGKERKITGRLLVRDETPGELCGAGSEMPAK